MMTRMAAAQSQLMSAPADGELMTPLTAQDVAFGLDLYIKCTNNAAMLSLQLERWKEAQELASEVLEHEPSNVKAWYRRGLARLGLYRQAEAGQETLLKAAEDDLYEARARHRATGAPSDPSIENALDDVRRLRSSRK